MTSRSGNGNPFRKVLVANRGEIALRVMRTCRTLGIPSVAVYSEADAEQRHVLEADEAVLIGPAEATASYLDVEAVVRAARATGADAVHPGYGFLSENAVFARACSDAGITFIGPPADVLEGSNDKLVVKRRVSDAGVPVIPGPLDAVPADDAALTAAANATGYPLLLKASAGGGGKGMRRVEEAGALLAAAEGARREAGGAFGNTELYLERIVQPARHVEVQVLCDAHDGVVVLGERDCSLQRRHQKVIEECPAPGLSDDVRAALHGAGADAVRALGYRGAGTVEFLMQPDGSFFFLEVNRRLQVEHPVTEMCFGVDLVAWQLRVAAGEALPDPSRFSARGHAIEARVYAEDPAQGFLPSAGRIEHASEPQGPGIRVDSALMTTMEVSPFYDPLLAKVVAHGETREEARRRLDTALRDMVIAGVANNVAFLRALLAHDAFEPGGLRIDALDDIAPELATGHVDLLDAVLCAAADELLAGRAGSSPAGTNGGIELPSPWDTLAGFRMGGDT